MGGIKSRDQPTQTKIHLARFSSIILPLCTDRVKSQKYSRGMCVCGGGGGGGGGGVILVRMCEPVFQNLPHSYTWPVKKTDPFIYLIIRNVDLFIYCPLIFCTHLLLLVRQISHWIHWIPREQAASKNLWAKICAYTRMSEKWGLSHRNPEKSGHSYTFCWKKGPNHIPGSAEKGGHSARTSILCHI